MTTFEQRQEAYIANIRLLLCCGWPNKLQLKSFALSLMYVVSNRLSANKKGKSRKMRNFPPIL